MFGKLERLIRGIVRIAALYFSSIPSIWVVLNPLLYIMFLPLGVNFAMTLPWPFLKDIPDPFGRGTTLYFLAFVFHASILDGGWAFFWFTVQNVLMLAGTCLFVWSFASWLKSRGKLITSGPYKAVRHPQYLGLIIAVLGLSLRSARPIALISWGTMTYAYVLMAYLEELALASRIGEEYVKYKAKTWFMIPTPKVSVKGPSRLGRVAVTLAATSALISYILAIIYISPHLVVSLRSVTY